MRVLIFHGYLLRGTGSNEYNAALGEAFARNGHEVAMVSQDREPLALPWIDAAGDWDGGALELTARRDPARAIAYRPDLGGILPVYVADRYDGVTALPFDELSDEQVEDYVARNVAAVQEVVARARPDVALANHLVMGPAILARALAGTGVPYAVKVHGSALEYTVKPYPRFMPAARAGLAPARGILVGSRHTAESLWAALDDPEVQAKTRLGPPGVDVGHFTPREPEAAAAGLERLRAELAAAPPEADDGVLVRALDGGGRRRARRARPRPRPDRGLHRQADRLQGRRAAAGGVAARARPGAGRAAAGRRLRRLPRARSRGSRPRWRAATSTPPARCARRTAARCPSSTPSSTPSAPRRPPTAPPRRG